MDKVIGQEYDADYRKTFLKDNCDKIEPVGYMKEFSAEEIGTMKDQLAEVSIEIDDIETAKKEAMAEFKDQIKPLAEEKATLLQNIKQRAIFTNEDCFKFTDYDGKQVGYYNSEGVLISSRPMKPDEYQMTFRLGKTAAN